MAHTNSTTNYNLPQWVGSDKPTFLGDLNTAFNDIDAQMKTNADGIVAADDKAENATTLANDAQDDVDALTLRVTTAEGNITNNTTLIGNNTTSINNLTSSVQTINTELTGKQNTITGAASTVVTNNLTASKVLVSDSSGKITNSSISNEELDRLSGVSSNIQTQLNNKEPKGWTHLTSLTASTTSQTYTNSALASADIVLIIVHGPSVIMGQPAFLPYHFYSTMVGSKTLFFSDPTLSGHNVTIGLASNSSINYYKSSSSSATVEIYYK